MDRDTTDLVAALCTQAAMIMEDVGYGALTIGSADPDERMHRLHDLSRATDRIRSLIDAALALES